MTSFVEVWEVMRWPLCACLLLPWILVYYGLHILRRGIIFVDLALAQVAALGTAVGLVLGHEPNESATFAWSVGFTLIGAAIFTFTRGGPSRRVPQEALIGVVYVVAAAAGIVVLSRSAEGNEELKRSLVGDILTVRGAQIWKTLALYCGIGLVHWLFRKKFMALSFAADHGAVKGPSRWWDFLFYALFGLVVTSFVQIGGVLLVFSYLIIPAACAFFLTESLGRALAIGAGIATLGGVSGLAAAHRFDFPAGAAIVCTLGIILLLVGIITAVRGTSRHP